MNVPPRRKVFSAADFESLVRSAAVRLPPPFDTTGIGPDDGGPVIPTLAVNLAILAFPDLLVRVDADLPGGSSRAVFALGDIHEIWARLRTPEDADRRPTGPRGDVLSGASLFALADGAVEMSWFQATWLGKELVRAVPEPPPAGVGHSLAPDDAEPRWAGRRVSRTALAEYAATRRLVGPREAAGALGLTDADNDLVADLTDRTQGTLRALVHGRPHGADRAVLVGRVVWIATDAGWYELAPSDVDEVELVPVTRERIGTRLAPMIAQVLAEVDDDAA